MYKPNKPLHHSKFAYNLCLTCVIFTYLYPPLQFCLNFALILNIACRQYNLWGIREWGTNCWDEMGVLYDIGLCIGCWCWWGCMTWGEIEWLEAKMCDWKRVYATPAPVVRIVDLVKVYIAWVHAFKGLAASMNWSKIFLLDKCW